MQETLYEKLSTLAASDEYPYHMPGHKRRITQSPFDVLTQMDITEIEGFDNLHHSEGILKNEQEFAATLYGSRQTFFLVNGSSCGVLSSILALTRRGESIVMMRTSHKSAYHALQMGQLNPYYVLPEKIEDYPTIAGGVTNENIRKAIIESGAKTVFLTSPTYEGFMSDIAAIAQTVHELGALLIVDEAHGAHLRYDSYFPESAIDQGADVVIQSIHKTMPALTQTALLHVCTDKPDVERIKYFLSVFETSSPSYVLMASISRCLHEIKNDGKKLFSNYTEKLSCFYQETQKLKHLKVLAQGCVSGQKRDPSKIVIYTHNLEDAEGRKFGGKELFDIFLQKYHLQMEMTSLEYVIAMTSIMDTQEGFDRLLDALFQIDENLKFSRQALGENPKEEEFDFERILSQAIQPENLCTSISQAFEADKTSVAIQDSVGKISGEYLYVYPPGSPLLVPGERITKKLIETISVLKQNGMALQGLRDGTIQKIDVLLQS